MKNLNEIANEEDLLNINGGGTFLFSTSKVVKPSPMFMIDSGKFVQPPSYVLVTKYYSK